nr:uncharacterized protein LOC113825042 [Penaeus vannamei]
MRDSFLLCGGRRGSWSFEDILTTFTGFKLVSNSSDCAYFISRFRLFKYYSHCLLYNQYVFAHWSVLTLLKVVVRFALYAYRMYSASQLYFVLSHSVTFAPPSPSFLTPHATSCASVPLRRSSCGGDPASFYVCPFVWIVALDDGKRSACVLVLLALLAGVAGRVAGVPATSSACSCGNHPAPAPGLCSGVALLHGTASDIRRSVLRELCLRVHQHVHLKTPQRSASNPKQQPKRTEQAAALNLHRDSFSDQVRWEAGEASDVINTANWFVDAEVPLSNGYTWYEHGLPLWPLLDQALTQKETVLAKKKKLNWPNYAIATPLYVAPLEASNSRDLAISVRKLFAGDTARPQQQSQNTFANSNKFQSTVLDFIKDHFQDQFGYTRSDIGQTFGETERWIQPLVKQSLRPMLESFMKRQKTRAPKSSDIATCPDEVYLFFLQKPCPTASTCQVILDIQQELRVTNCVNTDVVVGYTTARSASHG